MFHYLSVNCNRNFLVILLVGIVNVLWLLLLQPPSAISALASLSSTNPYQVTVNVDQTDTKGTISNLIYGNNTKWLFNGESRFGRDNGIWSREHNAINPSIIDFIRNSKITVLRYGDGTNVDFFYWGWSILPMEERLNRNIVNRWNNNENYVFGILEFVKLCQEIKCEANIIVNYRMSLLASFYDKEKWQDKRTKLDIAIQQAANLVEFLNAPVIIPVPESYPDRYLPEYSLQKMPQGYFAYLRAQMGFSDPVNVKYWEIGNETNVFHESGKLARKQGVNILAPVFLMEYTHNAIKFSKQMKLIDPSIKTGIVEYHKNLQKQLDIVSVLPGEVDFIIAHDYVKGAVGGYIGTYVFYGTRWGGGLSREIYVEREGTYILNVTAWGRAYFGNKYPHENGVAPRLAVKVNGSLSGKLEVNKNIEINNKRVLQKNHNYKLAVVLRQGKNTINIRLANDFMDKSSTDINRRGRDVFVSSIRLTGKGKEQEMLWSNISSPIYSQLLTYQTALAHRKEFVEKYAPDLFVAQTESAVFPNSGQLRDALVETSLLFAAMDNEIKIRNYWHLFGTCDRMGSIHSGTKREESYHVTPQYLVLKLFSHNFGDTLISCDADTPFFSIKSLARSDHDTDGPDINLPYLDVRASKRGTTTYISFVNYDAKRDAKITIKFQHFSPATGVLHILTSRDKGDLQATNEFDHENVAISSSKIIGQLTNIIIPAGSIAIAEYTGN